jgi:hypothetical protein
MHENASHLLLDALLRPFGMLAPEESCLVPAHGPIEPVCRAPPLLRRHLSKEFNLFRAGLLVRSHDPTVRPNGPPGKPPLEPLTRTGAGCFPRILRQLIAGGHEAAPAGT